MLGQGPLGAAPLGSEQTESGDAISLVATTLSLSSITADMELLVGLAASASSGSSITGSISRLIDLGTASCASASSITGDLESEDLLRVQRTDIAPMTFWI